MTSLETYEETMFFYDDLEEMKWHIQHLENNHQEEMVLADLWEQELSSCYLKKDVIVSKEIEETRQKILDKLHL